MLTVVQEAGWPFWMLLVCSCTLVTVIIERLMVLRASHVLPAQIVKEVVEAQKQGKLSPSALTQLEAHSALGKILAHGLKVPLESRAALQIRFDEAGKIVAQQLQKRMNILSTIATLSPLIGLLGTVIGMIEIFGAYTPQGAQASQLAQGISIALYNTGFGIFLAIPAYIAYKYFQAKIDDLISQLEQQSLECLDALFYTQLK